MKGFRYEAGYSLMCLYGCYWHFGQDGLLFGPHPLNAVSSLHVGTT